MVYECISGWQSIAYHLWINVALTSDLVLENNCVGSLSFEIGILNLCVGASCDYGVSHTIFGHCDLDLGP